MPNQIIAECLIEPEPDDGLFTLLGFILTWDLLSLIAEKEPEPDDGLFKLLRFILTWDLLSLIAE